MSDGCISDGVCRWQRCVACAAFSAERLCPGCIADLPWWRRRAPSLTGIDRVHVALEFTFPVRNLVQRAKFRGELAVLWALAELLQRAAPQPPADCVIYPVPMSRWRRIARGYNQAAVLGAILARAYALPVDEFSIKKRHRARRQSSLDRTQRRANAAMMFVSPPKHTLPARAVIVDDVVTTGSTAVALARALRHGGAREVELISLAAVRR